MKATFNAWLFNPVFWHIWDALNNPRIRRILVRGGSSAGKTSGICDSLNIHQLQAVTNVLALRKHRVHVETTIKQSFEGSVDRLRGLDRFYEKMDGEIRVATGARTFYAGMDDPEKVKGLESFDIVLANELNQFEPAEWHEINRRLRGRPNQKIIADWNPIIKTHWINTEILDESEGWIDLPLDLPELEAQYGAITGLCPGYAFKKINAAGDTLWINVTYRDNFWINGHPVNNVPAKPGRPIFRDSDHNKPVEHSSGMLVAPDGNLYGFVDKHTLAEFETMKKRRPNDYRIYGMGQDGLIRTGGEAWKRYQEEKHVRDLVPDLGEVIHLSVDNNLVPYVTVSFWQVIEIPGPDNTIGINELRQIAEVASRPPENTSFRAALATDKKLRQMNFTGLLFVHGDPSGRAGSTIDDDGRSFFDKFIGTLERLGWKVINKVARSAPAVAMSIEFINDVYDELVDNWRIVVDTNCPVSREDYSLVKEDPKNGKLLKEKVEDKVTGQRYEKYGHFSDAKRYFIINILEQVFNHYKNRTRPPRVMAVPEA
jgi:phage terminase large subunit